MSGGLTGNTEGKMSKSQSRGQGSLKQNAEGGGSVKYERVRLHSEDTF